MKYKNYIWDFDGTLADSYPHSFAALMCVLREEGLLDESVDREMVLRKMLVSFADMSEYLNLTPEVYDKFTTLALTVGEDEIEPKTVPFADAEAVLAAVVAQGGRNYIYTHRDRTCHFYLRKFGLDKYFTDYMTAEENMPSKPDPTAILALMKRNGLVPDESIMIGDREIDGMSGKNAGIAGALVNYPPHLPDGRSPAEVTRLDYTAKSLTEFARMMGIVV